MAQWLTNLTRIHEDGVRFLASLSGLRIQHCCERSQMWFGSGAVVAVAVAVAGSCSSNSTPSLGTSICQQVWS